MGPFIRIAYKILTPNLMLFLCGQDEAFYSPMRTRLSVNNYELGMLNNA